MNAAGQVLVEYLLLASIFLLLIAGISKEIPVTFSRATPFLGGKIEQRLQTGAGFAQGSWKPPVKPKGGVGQ
jgi:hypothetical protein